MTGRGPWRRSGMGRKTHGEVRNGSEDPRGGLGRVRGPSGRSKTGRETLGEVREESGDSGWSGPRRGTIREVLD